MIDALFKPQMDRLWAPLGRWAARLGLSPNAVTGLSVLLCAGNAAAYVWHGHAQAFAVGLLAFEALDNVDGALARATQRCTAFGSYLDAVADRYKDAMAFMAVGVVTQLWLACCVGMAGAMLVSYTQARAQAEATHRARAERIAPLFERLERVLLLAFGLLCSGIPGVLLATLWVGAALAHLTALQRIHAAARALAVR